MKITLEKAIAEFLEPNPLQTSIRFIFADDKPNQNRQGLPFSEFERVAKSAIGMPVKMRFTGDGVTNHEGSIPIGVIQSMETITVSDDYHQLMATATLWNEEYPEEIAWLKQAYADKKAPGISYELNYSNFDRVDNVEWLKDTYTGAATFVEFPAYGTRTALLALAAVKDKTELETGIIALAGQLTKPKNTSKGGNQMDEKELEALKAERDTFKAEAATKQSEIDNLTAQLVAKDTEVSTIKTELEGLKQTALIDNRVRKYTEAGFKLEAEAEKADKKKAYFASFTDEQFDEYLADLVAIKAAAPAPAAPAAGLSAMASLSTQMPRVEVPADDATYSTLKSGMRSLARPNSLD